MRHRHGERSVCPCGALVYNDEREGWQHITEPDNTTEEVRPYFSCRPDGDSGQSFSVARPKRP